MPAQRNGRALGLVLTRETGQVGLEILVDDLEAELRWCCFGGAHKLQIYSATVVRPFLENGLRELDTMNNKKSVPVVEKKGIRSPLKMNSRLSLYDIPCVERPRIHLIG